MTDATREPWLSYQHPAVRDLAWLIASAPLLPSTTISDPPCPTARWPDAQDYLALHARHATWLRALDTAPQALLTALSNARDHRLGRYAEDLLQFWLAAPDNVEFELVAEHVALREQGITLGELDFLVRERASGQLWHIELALKFYLGTEDQQWLGPNRQDSLERKLRHLCQQQLPLLQSPAGEVWLQEQGLATPKPWAWLKGRLFSAFATDAAAGTPQWFTPDALLAFARQHPWQWFTLGKRHWLAPDSSTSDQHAPFAVEALATCPEITTQALIAYDGNREVLRAFIVGKPWGQSAISLY